MRFDRRECRGFLQDYPFPLPPLQQHPFALQEKLSGFRWLDLRRPPRIEAAETKLVRHQEAISKALPPAKDQAEARNTIHRSIGHFFSIPVFVQLPMSPSTPEVA